MTRSPLRRVYLPALLASLVILTVTRPADPAPPAAPGRPAAPSARAHNAPESPALAEFAAWQAAFAAAPADRRGTLLAQGAPLATARREHLVELMRRDPAAALRNALPLAELAALPAELRSLFEQPLNGIGSIDLLWRTDVQDDGTLACRHEHVLHLGGRSWEVVGPAFRHPTLPRKDIPVDGISLGDLAVLRPSAVRALAPSDRVAAARLFPAGNPDGRDPVTGGPTDDRHAALVGGKVYRFETPAVRDEVAATLLAAEADARAENVTTVAHPYEWLAASGDASGSDGPPVDETPFLDDTVDVLFIRVDFSDFPGEPVSESDLATTLAAVRDNVEEFSYNAATIIPTVTPTVYRMPDTGTTYAVAGDNNGIQDDARALAAADFTIADYDVIAVFFPNLGDVTDSKITYGGLGSIGGANHWINGSNSTNIILHEFGHNYGLYHANYWDQSQTLPGEYDVPFSREYGDIFDRMGSASAPEGHFNHFHKNRLEWMPDSKVAEPVADATIRLYRFDHVNALANPTLAIKVPMGGDVFYWVGYRQLFTASSYNLASGAYIVAEGLSEGAETNLIDATPGSASPEEEDRKDSGLEIGAPFVDSGVTFTALARGGSEPNQWIDIGVSFAARVGLAATEVEIDEQAGLAWLTFQRQFSSAGLATVNFSTTDGSATAPADYYASAGTVTWPAGDTAEKVVAIPIRPDALAEGRESFTVTLTNATGASLDALAATATVSLLDPGQRCLTFAPGFFNNRIDAIVPLPNGQVLIGGNISANSGDFAAIHNLALLNPDGSVDPAFLTGSGFDGQVFALAVQADGNILVGGDFTSYDGTPCAGLVRLHSNGTIETAIGGVDNGTVRALALESDGKILVGGDFTSFAGSPAKGMVRLTSSGARDTAAPLSLPFVTPWDPTIHAIVLEADGRITVAGSFYIGVGGIRSGVARLHPDGTTDDSFDPGVGAHSAASTNSLRPVFALARQPDGKYLLGGFLTGYDGNPVDYLVRIDSDGSYDPSFTPPPFDASVRALALQPDGSVVAGGSFTSGGGRLVRLTPTGAVDSAFAIGTGTSGTVYSIAPDDSGMLYVGGNFFNFNGQSSRAIIKLAGGVSPYDLWARETFTVEQIVSGEADPQADPDADLSSNASERALGTDPLVPNGDHVFGPGSAGSITLHKTGGKRYLQVSVEKGSLATGAWFVAQFTRDAHDWSPAPSLPGINAVYDILEDSASRFVVRDKTPLGTGRRFVRIGIAHPQ